MYSLVAASHSLVREADALFALLGSFDIGTGHATARSYQPARTPTAPSPVHKLTNRMEKALPKKVAAGSGAGSWEEF